MNPEWDVLLSASQKNRPDLIRAYVTTQGIPASHANAVGQSALHIAALWGHVEAVRALVELGANVNAANSMTGATPLHMVAQSQKAMPEARLQVMDLLLQGGADPSKADKYGATPVQVLQMTTDAAATTKGENETEMDTVVVAQNKNPKMSHHETMRHQLLTKLQPQRPPLLRAILEHNLTIVEYVLCGDDDNVNKQAVTNQLYQGQSPVDVVVEELLQTITIASDTTAVGKEDTEQNVNINKDDDSLLAILTTLIMYGADANGGNPNQSISEADKNAALLNNNTNSNSDPPLHRLVLKLRDCFKQQPERSSSPSAAIATLTSAVCALLEAGASTRSIETEQLLHQAARFNEQSLARFLLETLHIPVNARGRQGMTPLQFAARSGQVEMVAFLLKQPDIDVKAKDDRGQTALDAARANQKDDVVRALQEFGG